MAISLHTKSRNGSVVAIIASMAFITSCMDKEPVSSKVKTTDPYIQKLNKLTIQAHSKKQPAKKLQVGDQIELTGGYDDRPLYLKNPPASRRTGVVTKFIEGQNRDLAAVVKLDDVISGRTLTGNMLILELRYEDQSWATTGPVHIELCKTGPTSRPWKERPKGEWIEAAASFRVIK